jgi:tetratricopeptide (TPR) repeat protein
MYATLYTGSAYGQLPLRSAIPISIPGNEACISSPSGSPLHANTSGATVSVVSMLIPEKYWYAYERVDNALMRRDFRTAQKKLDRAISTYPNSAIAWCLMGTFHEEQLQLEQASSDYSHALSLDSRLLPAFLGLARIAFRQERWQEVTRLTDQMARIDPTAFPMGHLYSAAAFFNLGEFVAAERNARKFQSLDVGRERPQVYLLLGDILEREHNYSGAAEEKELFLTVVPDAPDANNIQQQIKALQDLDKETRTSTRQ